MATNRRSSAQALASRQNGARAHGPTTAAGRARSAQNALQHGLRAQSVLLRDEDGASFAALAADLRAELAPASRLQGELVARIAAAFWRAGRADRLEAAVLGCHLGPDAPQASAPEAALGIAVIHDANGPRALDTLMRYRGSVLAELFRALAALKLLQAEAAGPPAVCRPTPLATTEPT